MAQFQLIEGPAAIRKLGEGGSTQTFKCGDPLIISSGQLIIATSGADVWGIAQQDASGTQATILEYYLALPGQIWSISVDAATTPALTSHVGARYDLTISAGATVLNIAGGAGDGWMVVDLDDRDVAAAGTRVLVTPYYSTCDAIGG